MLLLFETPAGFSLFKVKDEGKLEDVEALEDAFSTPEGAKKVVALKAFSKFDNTAEALAAAASMVDSKIGKDLKKFLKKHCEGETLALADAKLGGLIKEKLGIACVYSSAVMEMMRGVRYQLNELIGGLTDADIAPMALGLSHSLSRYKLKFSPDKVDTMVVQAIGLLDELDKELNTYAMRVREWYGWHFPEMTKIIADNMQYAKSVMQMGDRATAAEHDFSGILDEDVEQDLKDAAVISMGTEISVDDLDNIKQLADQVVSLSEYRIQLYDYLKSRMNAIAPNLTVLVGELVGARLISHAGSLINLAKHPASTVQILGAEKALFRALKTKHETPKYGLIYHASLIGQAAPKFKGKISRVLAAKCALSIRVDALGEGSEATIGIESRAKVEARLRQLEGKTLGEASGVARGKETPKKHDKDRAGDTPALLTAPKAYNPDSDVTDKNEKKKKREKEGSDDDEKTPAKKAKKEDKEGKSEKKEKSAKSEKKEKKDKKDKK
uniref:Nop domain-containing protein n=1 Tax=Mantoniella antarctica TaxID=81844 RepID=A0A6U3FQT3_9CHLO|mmetsp:Transcript_21818/g.53936  ORF Transcript_21818/g.53936 Transcript_21818/m.53936 type:complete len:498 (+) Transcript_21818:230-1723(+)